MKRYLIVLLLLIVCIIGLASCSTTGGNNNVEITTAKSGKVAVNLYDQTEPAEKQAEQGEPEQKLPTAQRNTT